MLHKVSILDRISIMMYLIRLQAPAAFGLVSFLMSDGIDRKRIRRHLLIFSLAAPLMAIFTYVLLKSVRRSPTFFSKHLPMITFVCRF